VAGWQEFLFGWGTQNAILDLETGDAIASGEDIFAGEIHVGGGGGVGVFESPLLRRKLQQQRTTKRKSRPEILTLGPGDVIASGEPISVTVDANADLGSAQSQAIAESIDVSASSVHDLAVVITRADAEQIHIEASSLLELEPAGAFSESGSIDIAGEHRGMFVVVGDVLRVTRPSARLRVRDDGLVEAA